MSKIFNEISRLPEFDNDFKKLKKKYSTLDEDLETFIEKSLFLNHKLKIDNKGVEQIPKLGIDNIQSS
jgi:hypothetical protein